jgi:TRAP transporter TAXI family solute receptor
MNNNVRVFFSSLWEWLLSFGPFVALGVALMLGAYHWLDPNPPKQVVLATGPEQSAYDAMGQHYAKALSAYGIDVTLLPSEGSAHNLALLRSGQADLAFVQGGSVAWADTDRQSLTALGNLFVEPLWVFYWQDSARRLVGRPELTQLRDLQGARINVGTVGSGVPRLFDTLLEANGIEAKRWQRSELAPTPAVVAFLNQELDVVVFASAPESPLVQMLLQSPGVGLMDFAQSEAYARRFGFLTPVVLPQGVVDLAKNQPTRDVRLVAPTTTLLARQNTHPALMQLFAQTAVGLHSSAGWFNRARQYPSLDHDEIEVSDEAARAISNGQPWLQRYLPFWLANLVERMWLAGGLILALVLPLSRILPPLYTLRVRSKVFRWYAELQEIEERVERSASAQDTQAQLLALDRLEATVEHVQVPLPYANELYALRSHIRWVRKRLMQHLPTN